MVSGTVLVVGENSVWQKSCSLPRLERGEVNRVREVKTFASGKGVNVARALTSLGGDAFVLGYAGSRLGGLFTADLRREGLRGDWTRIREETRMCTTYAEEDGFSTEIIEPTPRVSSAESARFLKSFMRRIDKAAFLIISGTTVEGEPEDRYSLFVSEAHKRSVPVLLDSVCAAADQALSQSPEILKINIKELAKLSGHGVDALADRVDAYRALMGEYGIRWIIATDGANGMEGFDGARLLRAAAPRIKAVKTIGGGDSAAAGIAASMLEQAGGDPGADSPGARGSEDDAPLIDTSGLERALRAATAAGTASCLTGVGGLLLRSDFLSILNTVSLQEVPLS
jgi:1-phosphofructokinase family hexose kinase